MKPIRESEKISLAECKKYLNTKEKNYSDEEIKEMRDFIYLIASITLEHLESKKDEEIKILCQIMNAIDNK